MRRLIMQTKISKYTIVCAIVSLGLGLLSATVAQSGCIDECSPTPLTNNAHSGAGVRGASTGTLHWDFKSNYRYKAGIKFYSETRKGHEWPSVANMWVLDDYKTHTFRLSCVPGEKICFGAWSTGNDRNYWGVGHGNRQGCQNCCHTCGDNAREMVLNP